MVGSDKYEKGKAPLQRCKTIITVYRTDLYVCVCVYVCIFLESLHVVLCVCIHSQSSLCLLYKDTNVH